MTAFTGTIPTIASGDNATVATNLAVYRDALKGASEAWTSYTPTWAGSGTNPVVNNGTLNGKYLRVNKLVIARIQLTIGSSTTFGTGTYSFAIPVSSHADYTANMHMGNGLGLDLSAVAFNALVAGSLNSGSVFVLSATGVSLAPTVPWTWATGDKLSLEITYETA